MTTNVRRNLAKRIEQAMFDQHGLTVKVDPARIDFPKGFYRTNVRSDTWRWSAWCGINGTDVGPEVDSYDTATVCARNGIIIVHLPYNRGWEATAQSRASGRRP